MNNGEHRELSDYEAPPLSKQTASVFLFSSCSLLFTPIATRVVRNLSTIMMHRTATRMRRPIVSRGFVQGRHSPRHTAVLAATGGAVGVFAVHTGLAGSLIALPVLHNLKGFVSKQVTGTVLLATSLSAGAGAASYLHHGVVSLPTVVALSSTGVIGAALGSALNYKVSPAVIKRMVGFSLLAISPLLFFGNKRQREEARSIPEKEDVKTHGPRSVMTEIISTPLQFWAVGAAAGFSQGLIGIGGGILMTTLMSTGGLFFEGPAFELPQTSIIGTALAASFVMNASASVVHIYQGTVQLRAAALISATACATAVVATKIALQLDEMVLRKLLGGAVCLSSLAMLR